MPQPLDFATLQPVIVLSVWTCVLLLLDVFLIKRKSITAVLTAFGLALTLGLTFMQVGASNDGFSGMVVQDGFSTFINALQLVGGLLGVAVAHAYIKRTGSERGEYYTLLLFSVIGMMLMAQSNDLIMVFIALELLSIPLYVLAAFTRNTESEEAGIKYFLLGAFSTGFVVYGIALVYGATASTNLHEIVAFASSSSPSLLLTIGAALILVGFAFKVAVVPFHMWTPDVYQGAPTAVTAFMSSGAKVAGFAALLRVFSVAFPNISMDMAPVLAAISALTMIVGNIVAVSQTNIKRMLAYSSIAHAGYILMAFVPYGDAQVSADAIASGLFYLVAYMLTNFGAWAVVIALETKSGSGLELSDYSGLAKKYPAIAAAMTIFMLSLIGFPPTLGMVGKFYLFRAALQGGYTTLALIGVITSLVSAFYYLRVIVNMYMREGDPTPARDLWLDLTWSITAIATVVVSLAPQFLFVLASTAVMLK